MTGMSPDVLFSDQNVFLVFPLVWPVCSTKDKGIVNTTVLYWPPCGSEKQYQTIVQGSDDQIVIGGLCACVSKINQNHNEQYRASRGAVLTYSNYMGCLRVASYICIHDWSQPQK